MMNRRVFGNLFRASCVLAAVYVSCCGIDHAAAQDAADQPLPETTAAESPPIVDTPAVVAIRDANPSTPAELTRAVGLLIQLDRTDLAAQYLERLMGLRLDDTALSRLHEQFGTAFMIRLMRVPELSPAGAEFGRAVLQAAKKTATDPARLQSLVARLGSGQRTDQLRAAAQLLRSGTHAVGPLIAAIVQADDGESLRRNAEYVLTRIGPAAVDPLVAFLSGSDASRRVAAIRALGRIKQPSALPHLVRPFLAPVAGNQEQQAAQQALLRISGETPNRNDALALLRSAAARAYAGETLIAPDIDGYIVVWTWDEPQQTVVSRQVKHSDAAAITAARHYRDLSRLDSNNEQAQIRYLVSRLEVDQSLGGLDQPLRRGPGSAFSLATQAGAHQVLQVLENALASGHRAAVMGAADVLEHLQDASVLRTEGRRSPLALALTDENQRVRFAAAQAIMGLSPNQPFPGGSRLSTTLGHFAASTGHSRVLIYHPSHDRGRTLAGLVAAAGFEPELVTGVDQLRQQSKSSPDWQLIMLSDLRNQPTVWSILEALRAEPMTAELPVVLMAHRAETLPAQEQTADASTRTLAVLEPLDVESLRPILSRALNLWGRDAIDEVRRIEHATAALDWLEQLAEQRSVHARLLSRQQARLIETLYTPELSESAARVLATIPTPRAQKSLVDLASQNILPLPQRQAAAKAFDKSIRSFGVLMTSVEIQQQYQRYNDSQDLDRETQQLLGSLLDSIEAPAIGLKSERGPAFQR